MKRKTINRLISKKGNVTVTWVLTLPLFMFFLLFLGSMATAWIGHAHSIGTADAVSLAVTKKMDGWVQRERAIRMEVIARRNGDKVPGDPGYIDPYQYLLGTEAKKEAFLKSVVDKYSNEIQAIAREYAEKNDNEQSSGTVIFSKGGRVEVIAETPYEPLLFQEAFPYDRVKGTGVGPKRYYLEWIPDSSTKKVRY
ncbi:hypothetical protein [Desmospora profundinema]|uniref:Flp pilus-assembly TadG-like N-terminal domain-containing protein n=1 Tax=Desmospora profundinema TaxID=1571184 RepID=A0ABU1IQH7_9BACL|nr:hypothetical protein [Desmospora profundinema]MDR6227066.1 hypothetical protein [Desmospora profundinema]